VLNEVLVYSPVDSALREIVIGAVLVLFLRYQPRGLLPERRYIDRLPRTNL
jgi:ABC-type branched-subunit amino acid transport system permease subunit